MSWLVCKDAHARICLLTSACRKALHRRLHLHSWREPSHGTTSGRRTTALCAGNCPTLLNMLVIIVGGIPIAMPTVLSVTLALGAAKLAKEGAIVAR